MVLNHFLPVHSHQVCAYSCLCGYNSAICVLFTAIWSDQTWTQSPRLLSKFCVRSSPAFHFAHTKILLITFVKWDFVCRTNSRLQVLSVYSMQRADRMSATYAKMECLCPCNVHAIKCLEPHAIYHEDDTCVQTELKPSAPFSFCAQPSLAVVHQTRSHYQCAYFHLHFIFIPVFYVFNIFPGCQHYHSCSLNICIRRTSYNLTLSSLSFARSSPMLCICVLGSNI